MQIRSVLIIALLLCSSCFAIAQNKDTIGLKNAVLLLNKALVQKDEGKLKKLVSKHIKYAHSNGWTETRKEMLDNMYKGILIYLAINFYETSMTINDNTGLVQSKGRYTVMMKEALYDFELKTTQVWQWRRGRWILMARQSVPLEK